jgi:hypothetical protein
MALIKRLPTSTSAFDAAGRQIMSDPLYANDEKWYHSVDLEMDRIRQMIRVDGRDTWALFDTGARNTYVVPAVADLLVTTRLPKPTQTRIGGELKISTEAAVLIGEIEGKAFHTEAMVLDRIGTDEEGNPIEILFGALAMQQWGIRLIPETESLDLSHYPSEFLEF